MSTPTTPQEAALEPDPSRFYHHPAFRSEHPVEYAERALAEAEGHLRFVEQQIVDLEAALDLVRVDRDLLQRVVADYAQAVTDLRTADDARRATGG